MAPFEPPDWTGADTATRVETKGKGRCEQVWSEKIDPNHVEDNVQEGARKEARRSGGFGC